MSPEWLIHDGRVIATSLVLSHPEQLDRLRLSCPQAAEVAVVTGDPAFDRMLASIPLRDLYRDALGIRGAQRLVLISSTWGPASLYGRQPDLVQRLRAELPLDDYQVAVALHPNTWSAHSPWQIRRWLETCTRSGVILFPADEGWRAGLLAADLVIGDHGSVTFYGASLGRPVLLAETPHDTVDPASAIGKFLDAAPRLHRTDPLRPQIETALANNLSSGLQEIAELTTATPLKSHSLLRTEFYRLLNLVEPDAPAEATALPAPAVTEGNAATQSVHVALELEDGAVRATVVRLPAELLLRGRPSNANTHLAVSTNEPSETALQLADVIVNEEPGGATTWITQTLAALPGAMVAARLSIDGSWIAGTRDGHRVQLDCSSVSGFALASTAVAWIAAGKPLCSLPEHIDLFLGGARYEITTTIVTCL
ncbi:hypothetical protein ACIRG5_28325 [Lentzea sp. NPDC102401]|uniref:hypothetical protein n=1 Tax=Lentzea sp. NPDC102401 TaxID=3364128 RepID=UPI00380E423C